MSSADAMARQDGVELVGALAQLRAGVPIGVFGQPLAARNS